MLLLLLSRRLTMGILCVRVGYARAQRAKNHIARSQSLLKTAAIGDQHLQCIMVRGGQVCDRYIMRSDRAYVDLAEFRQLDADLEFATIGADAKLSRIHQAWWIRNRIRLNLRLRVSHDRSGILSMRCEHCRQGLCCIGGGTVSAGCCRRLCRSRLIEGDTCNQVRGETGTGIMTAACDGAVSLFLPTKNVVTLCCCLRMGVAGATCRCARRIRNRRGPDDGRNAVRNSMIMR